MNPILNLATAAATAPSADNSQPWKLVWDGRHLALASSDRHDRNALFGPDSHATLLSVGAAMEALSATLAHNGRNARWELTPPGGNAGTYASLAVDDALQSQLEVPAAVLGRHTNRFPFLRTALPEGVLKHVESLAEGSARVIALSAQGERKVVAETVRTCSEARFCNQVLHEWLVDSLRYTEQDVAQGDGLDIRTLNLPPGGAAFLRFVADWRRMAALNRLGIYKLLAEAEAAPVRDGAAVLCIAGNNDREGVLDAGRLIQRAWSALNAQGVAVQPYYVVADQVRRLHEGTVTRGFEARVARCEVTLLSLAKLADGENIHMLMRIGIPRVTPQRSRRLPLDAILEIAPADRS